MGISANPIFTELSDTFLDNCQANRYTHAYNGKNNLLRKGRLFIAHLIAPHRAHIVYLHRPLLWRHLGKAAIRPLDR